MKLRTWSRIGATTLSAAVLLTFPVGAAPQAPRCGPGSNDVACRLNPQLYVHLPGHANALVTNANPNVLVTGTEVKVLAHGSSQLYFRRAGACTTIDPNGSGTGFLIRPAGFLFEQTSGLSICTFKGGYAALVVGDKKVRVMSSDTQIYPFPSPPIFPTAFPAFFAVIEAPLTAPSTQFRVNFSEGQFSVASFSGALLVRLPGDLVEPVKQTSEMRLILNSDFSIAKFEPPTQASFSPQEQAIFAAQQKVIR